MTKTKLSRRIISIALAVAMAFSIVAVGVSGAEDDKAARPDNSLMNLDSTKPSGFETTTNPYGYDVGMPFLFSEENELLFFATNNQQKDDGLKQTGIYNGDSRTKLSDFTYNQAGISNKSYKMPSGTWNMVEAVSFDPTNSGRNDHVAFVGVKYEDFKAYAWVYNAKSNTCSAAVEIGNMNWLDDSYEAFTGGNFFAIAAGDFNKDGKDTVVVFAALTAYENAPSNTAGQGSKLFELSYDGTTLTKVASSTALLHEHYLNRQYNLYYDEVETDGDGQDCKKSARNKLNADIAVGDFNADGYDDIAVLSYLNRVEPKNVNPNHYEQPVKVAYGGNGVNAIITQSVAKKVTLASYNKDEAVTYIPVAASIAAGDLDNNGYDDLIIAGMQGYYETSEGSIDGRIDASDDKMRIATIFNAPKYETKTDSSGNEIKTKVGSMELVYNETVDASGWTNGGWHQDQDDCWQPYAVETVAINGQADREYAFINGELFDVNTGIPQSLYRDSYFDGADDYHSNGSGISNTFMSSSVVGNFDGNDAGREQVVFTIGLKEKGQDDYSFKTGYVGGAEYSDTVNSDGETVFGTAQSYTGTEIKKNSYVFSNKGCNFDEGVNCIVVDVDIDNDGVLARYRGADFAYTDPDVKAVLQAAPYFAELSDSGNNSTGYVLETVYEFSRSSSDSVSFSVGVAGEIDTDYVEISLEAGCSADWSQSYEETLTETWSKTFSATAYDTVVVNRTPVFIYSYDIQKADGTWATTDKEKNENVTYLSIPQEPVYESMSIDKYNQFVDDYNLYMSTNSPSLSWHELHKIDKAENWMDNNEGNPYAYNQLGWSYSSINAKQISKSPITLGTNNAVNTVEWSESNAVTESTEISHGFYFSCSALFGVEQAKVGVTYSLDYAHGSGSSTTNASAIGTSCSVTDIDGPGLVEAGVPQSVVDSYTFMWTLGQWERHLGGEDGHKTVFVGYNLENLNTPALSVNDLKAKATDVDEIQFTWTAPDRFEGWPEITGYYIYQVEDGEYTRVSERLDRTDTSYTLKGLESNTSYDFVISTLKTVDKTDKESIWSNIASATTLKDYYTVNIDIYDPDAVEFSAKHLGNVDIKDGDKIIEDSGIMLSAQLVDESYSLAHIVVVDKNGTRFIYPDSTGKLIEDIFAIESDTQIIVVTNKKVSSSQVEFSSSEQGDIEATVNGVKINEPGATVNDSVVFTATPKDGYALKEWQITDKDGNVTTVNAAGQNPFTLNLTSTYHKVEAVFIPAEEASVKLKINYADNGGVVTVTNSRGEEIALDASSSATVPLNSVLTFTAKPVDGCTLKAWSGDAKGQTSGQFSMQITEDTTIGISFNIPVMYALTYGTDTTQAGGALSVSPAYASGENLPANASVVFSAQADANARVERWVVTQGSSSETIYPADFNAQSDTLEITLLGKTDVMVYFAPEISYTLTYSVASTEATGEITVTPNCASGDKLLAETAVTLTAQATGKAYIERWVVTQGEAVSTYYPAAEQAASDTLELTVNADTDVKVYFEPIRTYALSVGGSYTYTGKEIIPDDITALVDGAEVSSRYYDIAVTDNIKVGTATVTATFKNGYNGSASATFEIEPAELTVKVKISDKQYDGLNTAAIESAELEGVAAGDEVTLINGTPTFADVKVGKNIAVYLTDFAISGADAANYFITQPSGIKADIYNSYDAKAGVDYSVNSNGWLNEDFVITSADGYELSLTDTADGQWKPQLVASEETEDGEITFYVRNKATGAISEIAKESYKIDKTNPTGTVSIGENAWREFLHTITFNLFFNDTQTVKIEAEDVLSGVEKTEYYRSYDKLTQAKVASLPDVDWTEGDSANVEPDDCTRFIYYVRITDKAGNITYLSTDGAKFDTQVPELSGVVNGDVYYTQQTVTADDKDLDVLLVNGKPVENPAVLTGNVDAVYVITAVDKAGNKTTVTVTMKTIASLAVTLETLNIDNVNSDDLEIINKVKTDVINLKTKTADERAAVNGILEKCEELVAVTEKTGVNIDALKAEVNSYDIHRINKFQEDALEDLLARIQATKEDANTGAKEAEELEILELRVKDMIHTVNCLSDYILCPTRIFAMIADFFTWIFTSIFK